MMLDGVPLCRHLQRHRKRKERYRADSKRRRRKNCGREREREKTSQRCTILSRTTNLFIYFMHSTDLGDTMPPSQLTEFRNIDQPLHYDAAALGTISLVDEIAQFVEILLHHGCFVGIRS